MIENQRKIIIFVSWVDCYNGDPARGLVREAFRYVDRAAGVRAGVCEIIVAETM